jgi:hypothetical protein
VNAGALARGAVGLLKFALGIDRATEPERVRRLSRCAQCPHLNRESLRCKVCGCYTPAKAAIASERCPERVW